MKTYRVEQKYLMPLAQYQGFSPVIAGMLDRDSHAGPQGEYMIRSLYFDDIYQSAYEEKLGGVFSRKKYRIRVYNCQDRTIHLECKYKQGPYISKESVSLTREEYERIRRGDCRFLLEKGSPMAGEFCADYYSKLLRPKVIVDYEREPYVLEAGTVRITFDKAVRAADPRHDLFDRETPAYLAIPPDRMIMEIKYTGYLPERVRRLFRLRDLPQTSASKYCLCVDRLAGIFCNAKA